MNGGCLPSLPSEKATALDNLAENNGPTDGVSQTATAPPTSVLVTLAAAGRNPTDILIPTQAGTDGSGGDDDEDDDLAGGGSVEAMDDGPTSSESHLVSKDYGLGSGRVIEMVQDDIRAKGGVVPEETKPVNEPQLFGTAFDGVNTVEVAWPQSTWIEGRGPLAGRMVLVTPPVPEKVVRGYNIACAVGGLGVNLLEGAAAYGLAVAPEPTLLSKPAAAGLAVLAANGAQANIRTILSGGDPTPTLLNQVVTKATGNEYIGAGVDGLAHTAGPIIGAARFPKLSSSLRAVGPTEAVGAAAGPSSFSRTIVSSAADLSPRTMASFVGGRVAASVTETEITLYRVYGGEAGRVGSYLTRTKPTSAAQAGPRPIAKPQLE